LFPRFASDLIENSRDSALLFRKAVTILFLVIFPITLFTAVYAKEILQLWINPEFAEKSYLLMQVFSFGILINCLAHIPFTLIQSVGKARVTALIHTAELPLFAITLWLCATHLGLVGAVLAWLARMLIDTIIMFAQAGKIVDLKKIVYQPSRLVILFGIVMLSFFISCIPSALLRAGLFVVSNIIVFAYCWRFFVGENERLFVIKKLFTAVRFHGTK